MITRKQFLATAAGSLAAPAFGLQTSRKGTPASRPKNVLLLMCDEHQPHAFGIDGNPLARTPNLDALARQSVRFDHAYCTSPVCVPSRFSMMTGFYPHKGRIYGNNNPWPSEFKTIAQHFAAAGYATANIGKMHSVDTSTHGFEHFLEIKDWFRYLGPKQKIWDEEMDKKGKDGRKGTVHVGRVSLLPEEDHFESWVARESIQYLNSRKDGQPFFLVSSFIKPHDPFMPAERFAKLYQPEQMPLPDTWGKLDLATVPRRVSSAVRDSPHTPELLDPAQARIRIAMYYANLMQSDDRIGTVLRRLRELGLEDDTIIAYTSDHGDMVGDKGLWLKFQMYENSVGIPLMFRVPRMTHGERCGNIASLVHMLPTLAELCGVPIPPVDGTSLAGSIGNPGEGRDQAAYSEFGLATPNGMQMYRRGNFKYIYNRNDMEQLYDMRSDPKEMTNLALLPRHKETVARMRREMSKILPPYEVPRTDGGQRIGG